ncbi:hypothetical protein PR048_019524 [Dryococelus australis]|uniref:Uncharacterized protein n=1 Tax=Dryococelus australis TaxID=614101 RepID=A0ABQ9H3P7_9NEOP|nr:hypothetical protein PR048_019524 [Dryococelus australis]
MGAYRFLNCTGCIMEKCSIANKVCAKEHMHESSIMNLIYVFQHLKRTSVYFAYNIIMPVMRKRCIWKYHIKNKHISREMKRADVEMALKNSQIRVCDFDLQSVLQTPCGELSVSYYKRRLNVYNFTMHQRMFIVTFEMRHLETKEQ